VFDNSMNNFMGS